jgi:hypothetical protein
MSATEDIEKWIAEHGNVRDALNVAITRLRQAEERIAQLVEEIEEMNNRDFREADEN